MAQDALDHGRAAAERRLAASRRRGQTFERPTILPLPGELAGLGNVAARARPDRRAGRVAAACSRRAALRRAVPSDTEARLLFNYLRGDFRAALADLEFWTGKRPISTSVFRSWACVPDPVGTGRSGTGADRSSPISSRTPERRRSARRHAAWPGRDQGREPGAGLGRVSCARAEQARQQVQC